LRDEPPVGMEVTMSMLQFDNDSPRVSCSHVLNKLISDEETGTSSYGLVEEFIKNLVLSLFVVEMKGIFLFIYVHTCL
jgi:hypothetical protein